MARPSVAHDGFIVPNASSVSLSNRRMGEVDQIDFNTLANVKWGVIVGCGVTVSGTTASTLGGIALVNGNLVQVPVGSQSMSVGGTLDRFDLLGVDTGGAFKIVPGIPSVDAVFPDPPGDITLLGAVFCAAGSADFSDTLIDKRKFIPSALMSQIVASGFLVENLASDGLSIAYSILGDGTTAWAGDTKLSRLGAGTLLVQTDLVVDDSITAGGDINSGGDLSVTGDVYAANIEIGTEFPTAPEVGMIFQSRITGKIYARSLSDWDELVTSKSAVPVGTIIDSMESKANMLALGWLPFDGGVISEDMYPTLFALDALVAFSSGIAPHRTMQLPDLSDRYRTTNWSRAGQSRRNLPNTAVMDIAHMAPHEHHPVVQDSGGFPISGTISPAGSHSHGMTGGEHDHSVNDPGHIHFSVDFMGLQMGVITAFWGGTNKLDALFNDRNHTISVEALVSNTGRASTGITISTAGSAHTHLVSDGGSHDHLFTGTNVPAHGHVASESLVGGGQAIDFTPADFTVFTYIRF